MSRNIRWLVVIVGMLVQKTLGKLTRARGGIVCHSAHRRRFVTGTVVHVNVSEPQVATK